jgi:D-alanyl-lipoteichoic acid acyltransferase DltB (MBOAT superfamily)
MSVCSIEWVLLLLVASIVFFWLPSMRARQIFLSACNFGFLWTLVSNRTAWASMIIFLAAGYSIVRLMKVKPRRVALGGGICAFVLAFLLLKQYSFLKLFLPSSFFEKSIAIAGLSYMLFRQIHLMVDSFEQQIEKVTLWNYLNYQLNLFGFVAGPIQRYQEFCRDWENLTPILPTVEAVLRAWLRIFLGVLKISWIAASCLNGYEKCAVKLLDPDAAANSHPASAFISYLGLFYLYPIFIYFNFSGYCDMVIGGASVLGLKMPENFDRPYLARNMIEYWTRWHRTLGFWIRDYVFTPMYKSLMRHSPTRASTWAIVCYFVALFLTGIWHGAGWNFVIFGLLNGIGVSSVKIWEMWLVRRLGRNGLKNYLRSTSIRRLAVIVNFHYVCLTIFFFPGTLETSLKLLKSVAHAVF